MKIPRVYLLRVVLVLALGLAGPGCLSAAQPFRQFGPDGVNLLRDLIFPSQDPQYQLAVAPYSIWASHDGGASWRSLTAHLPLHGTVRGFAIDPFDNAHFLLMFVDAEGSTLLHESRNAGSTWSIKQTLQLAYPTGLYFDTSRPNVLVLGNLFENIGGLLSRDGGQTWQSLSNPSLPNAFGQILASHAGRFFFQVSHELWSFDPGSNVWEKLSTTPEIFTELKGDLSRTDTLFARYRGDLYRSADGGRTFELILEGGAFYGFFQSPRNNSHLVAFDGLGLSLSLDRGSSWTAESRARNPFEVAASFDPESGELLFYENGVLVRRRLDGTRVATRPRGLQALSVADVFLDPSRAHVYALASDGMVFRRDASGRWSEIGKPDCFQPQKIAVTPWNPSRLFVTCGFSYSVSDDGGLTWMNQGLQDSLGIPNKVLFDAGSPGSAWLVNPTAELRSLDPPEMVFGGVSDAVFHPDPAQGFMAIANQELVEWNETTGLQTIGTLPESHYTLAQDPSDPNHLFSANLTGTSSLVSFDRGRTWETRQVPGPPGGPGSGPGFQPLIDPQDPHHILLGGGSGLSESYDGATSWQYPRPLHTNLSIALDDGSNLYFAGYDGLQRRSAAAEACGGSDESFCAREGRFELRVEWTAPGGRSGLAKRVQTGSQESGLFYFFDENNWELLVKVLDGCSLNDRFWVFTAGTTDVEYLLKVEDRYTGKVRTYFNQAGKAAEATTDTDAFATCGAAAPAGSPSAKAAEPVELDAALPAEAPAPLELVNGRFEVSATWTDFEGQTGFGTPTPLRSANSGLFWFFSPDNWEVLLKVLDGCAINGHYWVLAAATTNVGYTLTVNEKGTPNTRTYSNPVGTPSPAQIDVEAFACPAL